MPTQNMLAKWSSIFAVLVLILSAQGAAAQPLAVPNAAPPSPNLPQGFSLRSPPNCTIIAPFEENATAQPIADFGQPGNIVTSTIALTQSLPYVWTVVIETFITHTYSGDLDLSLISPAGTKVTLSHRNGVGNNNVYSGTVWTDLAFIPTTDAVYQDNVAQPFLVPEEAMGAFEGESGTGTWSLVIADLAGGDTGWLNGWLFQVFSLNEPPIVSTTHFGRIVGSVVPNLGSLDSTINVSGVGKSLLAAKLTTDISHPKPKQLDIGLTSPTAQTTTISTNNGGSLVDWFAGTHWYDKAGATYPPGPVTMGEAAYPTSPLTATVPEGALSHFLGVDPNGVWNLHIQDEAPAPGFTLNKWALDVTTGYCLAHDYLPVAVR